MEKLIKMLFEAEDNIKAYDSTYWIDMTQAEFKEWQKGLNAIKKTREEIKQLILEKL